MASAIAQGSIFPVLATDPTGKPAGLEQLLDWCPVDVGLGAPLYSAFDPATQSAVLVQCISHSAVHPEQIEDVACQLRLIQSHFGLVSGVRDVRLDAARPYVVFSRENAPTIREYLVTSDVCTRLLWLSDFLEGVQQCFGKRLYHGGLSLDSVRVHVGRDPNFSANYLSRFHGEKSVDARPTYFELYRRDLLGVLSIVDAVVRSLDAAAPVHSSPEVSTEFIGSLKARLVARGEASDYDARLDDWADLLRAWSDSQRGQGDRSGVNDDGTFAADINVHTFRGNLEPGSRLGRYRIECKLGQGGMGAVYRAVDTDTSEPVALKVLRAFGVGSEQAVHRFRKESRILAHVQSPHVTQLIEVGSEDGLHYLAMELVDGIDLKRWLSDHQPLDERSALEIVSRISSALIGAHEHGIIHRDLKPENVLVPKANHGEESVAANSYSIDRLKLTDFGIARQIQQSESMAMTQAGGLLGTPSYMSPEQFKAGSTLDARTDIYALGVTLFEMLSGQVPFHDSDFMKLAAMHCFDPIPNLRQLNANISETTCLLVNRMLAKSPSDRPGSARELIREIDRILGGESNQFAAHPSMPAIDSKKLWERTFVWNLSSSPTELWPHVTNTERLNKSAGFPAVQYRLVKDPVLGTRRFGSFRLAGLSIEWEEHPFEWIEGHRMGVLREFSTGPFKWFMSSVELRPQVSGGTQLVHQIRIEPRNTLGKIVSTIEAGWKGRAALDRVYRQIDASLQSTRRSAAEDVFAEKASIGRSQSTRLEQRISKIVQQGATWEIADALSDYLRAAPAQELRRIRPSALAERLNMPGNAMLETCLLAACHGVLELQWDLVCPTCRVVSATETLLSRIQEHTQCEACDIQFRSNIGDAIELTFRIHPEIRKSDELSYCIGGPWHAPHVVTQLRLEPGERICVPLTLSEGQYLLRCIGGMQSQVFSVRSQDGVDTCFWRSDEADSARVPSVLRAGTTDWTLLNASEHSLTVRLERMIERKHVTTATQAMTAAKFRELFPEQSFASGLPMEANHLTMLVARLSDVATHMIDVGDDLAYQCYQNAFDIFDRMIEAKNGSVVRTTSDGLVAVFQECVDACDAAIGMVQEYRNQSDPSPMQLHVGIHRGRTLVSQRNGRIDYFGATVRLAVRLIEEDASSISLSESVHSDIRVQEFLSKRTSFLSSRFEPLAGVPSQIVQRMDLSSQA